MGIDFGGLISKAVQIAWRHPSLWIFGLFTGAGVSTFNFDSNKVMGDFSPGSDLSRYLGGHTIDFDISEESGMLLAGGLILWILAVMVTMLVCYLISQPAIIDAVNKVTRGGKYRFGESFSTGIDFFWRFLGITLLQIITFATMVFMVVIFAIILTPFSLLLTVPVAIILSIVIIHNFMLAEVAMVARNTSIADSLSEGFDLIMRNKINVMLITLIYIAFSIGLGIVMLVAALVLFLPINLLAASLAENLLPILLLGLFFALPISLVIGGFTGTFFNALYVQFYFALYEPTGSLEKTTGVSA